MPFEAGRRARWAPGVGFEVVFGKKQQSDAFFTLKMIKSLLFLHFHKVWQLRSPSPALNPGLRAGHGLVGAGERGFRGFLLKKCIQIDAASICAGFDSLSSFWSTV